MKKKLACLIAASALPLLHPYGPVRAQHPSTSTASSFPAPFTKACQNCHSERTRWPLYSYLPGVSWVTERDVAQARRHFDLSQWDRYSLEQKRDLLAAIAAAVRNRQMPPPRYLWLHSEARLAAAEMQAIVEWTRAQRRALRSRRE